MKIGNGLNEHKTFRRCPERLLNALRTSKAVNLFKKSSLLDLCLDSKYVSGI